MNDIDLVQEEEEEEDEEDYDDDFREDDLMWFDGHEGNIFRIAILLRHVMSVAHSSRPGVSGDFTKTFKAEVAGNRQ